MITGTIPVTASIAPTDVTDTYPTHDAIYGKGGLHHVAAIIDRDAIPAERRREGMLCYVDATGLSYQLQSDLTTWVPFLANGGGTTYLASFGDSSPAVIYELLPDQAIGSIDVNVVEAWDGVGASIEIGVVGDTARYFAALDTELTIATVTFSKEFSELGPKQIIITITPGTSPTTGKVRVQISTTTSGT